MEQRTQPAPAHLCKVCRVKLAVIDHGLLSVLPALQGCNNVGVDVFLGEARFTGADTVEVDGKSLRFANAVVATGARAALPPIDGLDVAGYLDNETVFQLTELPRRLAVIGGGPIGCELAQTFGRLGAEVHVFEMAPRVLPRDDADASEFVRHALERDGVHLHLGTAVTRVEAQGEAKVVHSGDGGATEVHAPTPTTEPSLDRDLSFVL